jgi:hypothetical protein
MKDGAKEREERPAGQGRRRGGPAARPGSGHGPPRRPSRPVAPRPAPAGGNVARALGLAATVLLLAVGVTVLMMVTRDGGGEEAPERFAGAPAATPKASARARRAARPRGPRLTNAQRASREAAVAQLRRQGFEPVSVASYRPRQELRVLIGKPKKSTDVRGRRAFFFVREQYIGTDAAEPSLRLRVARQRGEEITLAYERYAAGDKSCCPSDGTVRVRFAIGDGRLQPLDPIPPVASRLPPP